MKLLRLAAVPLVMVAVGLLIGYAGQLCAHLLAHGAAHFALLVAGAVIWGSLRVALWGFDVIERL